MIQRVNINIYVVWYLHSVHTWYIGGKEEYFVCLVDIMMINKSKVDIYGLEVVDNRLYCILRGSLWIIDVVIASS